MRTRKQANKQTNNLFLVDSSLGEREKVLLVALSRLTFDWIVKTIYILFYLGEKTGHNFKYIHVHLFKGSAKRWKQEGVFWKWEKMSKKRLFSSKIGENLRDLFSQNWRKLERYFLQNSEKAANKFSKGGGSSFPAPGRAATASATILL